MAPRLKPILLRVWRDVPFPGWMREGFLRILNPSFMIGAMALIQDERGRILVLEHTYRRELPWGLPGGWLKHAESPEAGLAREVWEETGLRCRLGAELEPVRYRDHKDRPKLVRYWTMEVVAEEPFSPNDEVDEVRWLEPEEAADALSYEHDRALVAEL